MTDERVKRIAAKARRLIIGSLVNEVPPFVESVAALYVAVAYVERVAPRVSEMAKEMLEEDENEVLRV